MQYYEKYEKFCRLAPELMRVQPSQMPELIVAFYFSSNFELLSEEMIFEDCQIAKLVDNCMEIFEDEARNYSPDQIIEAICQYCYDAEDYSMEMLLTCTDEIVDSYIENLIDEGCGGY